MNDEIKTVQLFENLSKLFQPFHCLPNVLISSRRLGFAKMEHEKKKKTGLRDVLSSQEHDRSCDSVYKYTAP